MDNIGKILLVGEPMGLFIACEEAPLAEVSSFKSAVAGAEINVAIGLRRLGHDVSYLTRLGRDPFGEKVSATLKKNDIDQSNIIYSDERTTGFMLKGKTSSGDPQTFYYRKNSAASELCLNDVKGLELSSFSALHMTGIFPALSPAAREATFFLMESAKNCGLTVFFDPNLRSSLWSSTNAMIETLNELALMCDYILPGYKEGEMLCGTDEYEKIADFYLSRGVKGVAVKIGKLGAFGATAKSRFISPPYPAETIIDTVGAGDGFAAGVISAVCEGLSFETALARGNAIGALQVMNSSDNEGLPTRSELEQFMKESKLSVN